MKQHVLSRNLQYLIIILLLQALLIPKDYSQTLMASTILIWCTILIVRFLIKRKKTFKTHFIKEPYPLLPVKDPLPIEPPPSPADNSKNVLSDYEQTILCHLSLRITEKLKSAYPQISWTWNNPPDLTALLDHKVCRIQVSGMDSYTHSDIHFDRYGRLHIEPLIIGTFCSVRSEAPEASDEPVQEPNVIDPHVWYELIGQKVFEKHITELNAGGHGQLIVKENGDIVITHQKKEVFKDSFASFPGKNYWNDLISILEEDELKAQVTDKGLLVSWT